MKKLFTSIFLAAFAALSFTAKSQNITFSETINSGFVPLAQCQSWNNFLAQLIPSNTYYGFTVTGSLSSTTWTCTDPAVATAVANALHTATPYQGSSDGQTWRVYVGCANPNSCTSPYTQAVSLSNYQDFCSCGGDYSTFTIRPAIGNGNWGGVGTNTCVSPTQTITVTFITSQAPGLTCGITYPNNPIDPLYAAAGANDPSVYYVGLSGSKVLVATTSGGTAPYTYQWSTTTGGNMTPFANKPNKAQLNYPTQNGDVQVIVTDANNVSCTTTVALTIMDYTCPPQPGMLWYYQLCNTQTNISSCVQGTANMRSLLQTGNYVFGTCNAPQKTESAVASIESFTVSPNPTNGTAFISFNSTFSQNVAITVVDLNGRLLQSHDLGEKLGLVEQQVDLSSLSNGLYFITLTTDSSTETEKIQVLK